MSKPPEIVPVGQVPELGMVPQKIHYTSHRMLVARHENKLHGTVSCLVGAPRPGLKNLEETRAAIAKG